MIKFEFPADRTDIALAIGQALVSIGGGVAGTELHAAPTNVTYAAPADDEDFKGQAEAEQEVQNTLAEESLDQAAVNDFESQAASGAAQNAGESGEVDQKGVRFDPKYCAKAEKPFYASGKNKGQWKKKGGANGPTEDMYDIWYAAQLLMVTATPDAASTTTTTAETQVDVGQVWGAQSAPEDVPVVPQSAGELFAWISEQQTAGKLTQEDIDAAYPAINLQPQQLWTANADDQRAMAAALYANLSPKVA